MTNPAPFLLAGDIHLPLVLHPMSKYVCQQIRGTAQSLQLDVGKCGSHRLLACQALCWLSWLTVHRVAAQREVQYKLDHPFRLFFLLLCIVAFLSHPLYREHLHHRYGSKMVAVPLNTNFKTLLACAASLVLISVCFCFGVLYNPSQPPHHFVDPAYGILRHLSSVNKPRYAIATFLTHDSTKDWDRSDVQNDFAFIGTRILTYQLLYANETKLRDPDVQFIVLCTPTVSLAKRQQLMLDGATIITVDKPPLPSYLTLDRDAVPTLDHFSKLRMFAMTQYDRILFLAPQTFLTGPIEQVFDDRALHFPQLTLSSHRPKEIKEDEAPLPANYLFGARSDSSAANNKDPYWHEYPPAVTNTFCPMAYLLAPSLELYALIISALNSPRLQSVFDSYYDERHRWPITRWRQTTGPESALLKYVFRREGTMPWVEMDPRWSASWGNQKDLNEKVVSLNGEYWWSGDMGVRDVWVDWKARMEAEFA